MVKDVSIEITQKCINNCLHCSSCSTYVTSTMISYEKMKEIVDDLYVIGVERICLSGGEPFIHPQLLEIVGYISDKGIIVDIYSSGIIGSPQKPTPISNAMLKKLKVMGLHSIIFNMPAADETTYDYLTQSTNHFPVLIRSVERAPSSGLPVEIVYLKLYLLPSA